jgi:hypothetical protein
LRSRIRAPALPDRGKPVAGVVVYDASVASAVRMASAGASSEGLTTSASDSWGNAMRTYTSKPGGPYRTRSHQSTFDRSNHRATSMSAAGRISVTPISLVHTAPPATIRTSA